MYSATLIGPWASMSRFSLRANGVALTRAGAASR
jgi:hypothetical protein